MWTHAKKGYNNNHNAGEADQTIWIHPNLQLFGNIKRNNNKAKKGIGKGIDIHQVGKRI